jgi:hypothetical protein
MWRSAFLTAAVTTLLAVGCYQLVQERGIHRDTALIATYYFGLVVLLGVHAVERVNPLTSLLWWVFVDLAISLWMAHNPSVPLEGDPQYFYIVYREAALLVFAWVVYKLSAAFLRWDDARYICLSACCGVPFIIASCLTGIFASIGLVIVGLMGLDALSGMRDNVVAEAGGQLAKWY